MQQLRGLLCTRVYVTDEANRQSPPPMKLQRGKLRQAANRRGNIFFPGSISFWSSWMSIQIDARFSILKNL
jgi:hypothetical protein